jgi:hypothetical protein
VWYVCMCFYTDVLKEEDIFARVCVGVWVWVLYAHICCVCVVCVHVFLY